MKRGRPTADEVWDVLDYQSQTGRFRWRRPLTFHHQIGDDAGSKTRRGYIVIMLWGVSYPASHLAWLMHTGEWPAGMLDHEDLNKGNNRFANLRAATKAQNNANVGLRKDNTSGIKGVSFHRTKKRWCASISHEGRQIHLGYFQDAGSASAAYASAARSLKGEFARL